MRNWISGMGAAFVLACGGPAAEFDALDTSEPAISDDVAANAGDEIEADIGELRQGLSFWDAYGVDGVGDRCWTEGGTQGWGGGSCSLPATKKIYYKWRASTCTGVYAADYQAAVSSAFQYISTELALNGWSSELVTSVGATNDIVATIECGAALNPASVDAAAQTSLTPINCVATTPGTRCRHKVALTRLIQTVIQNPTFVSAAQSLRRMYLRNIIAHEMGHVAGLGHDLCGASPLAELMAYGGCMKSNNVQTWVSRSLRTFERDMLFNFQP